MPAIRSHALVIGYVQGDLRRYRMIPRADIKAGRCVGCSREVYLNAFGVSAIRERDADVCCMDCERNYDADLNRSLIES